MTELRFETKTFRGGHLGPSSELPPLYCRKKVYMKTRLEEDDGLFVGYGSIPNILPYQMQDRYDRAEDPVEFHTAVLENAYLKATFVPDLGGRMWSLYDKIAHKDLLVNNPVFRPANLALRNAWICGGVEWNMGMIGHSPMTCSPLFTGRLTAADGTPVLRMYAYERIRKATYQMDFFLPEDSRFLFARMRIVNPNRDVVPMYWWSNMALPEQPGSRVIVPAEKTFTNDYISETERGLTKVGLPMGSKDFDLTYPTNNPIAIDYFFDIPEKNRKYETQLDQTGYGLIHTSTDRLQGRKLFVWGQGPGGRRWQKYLTNREGVPYQEMQAGLAHTQTECLPMPPKTAWEWMEAYGAMQADPGKVHGDWNTAVETVSAELEKRLPREKLDSLLQSAKEDFVFRKAELIWSGSGWGALENQRRLAQGETALSEHLDFGPVTGMQKQWETLLQTGKLPDRQPQEAPGSYMVQDEWFDLLKEAVRGENRDSWYAWLHLGICWFYRADLERAEQCFEKSLSLEESVWGIYCMACLRRDTGDQKQAAQLLAKASALRPGDSSLAREAMLALAEGACWQDILVLADRLEQAICTGRIQLFCAQALAHLGKLDQAEDMMLQLHIADIREGETSTSQLWVYIQTEKARLAGRTLKEEDVEIPASLDFRMNAE